MLRYILQGTRLRKLPNFKLMPEGQRQFPESLMETTSKALEQYNATTILGSVLKGNWKALLSFLKGEHPGLEALQETLTEIQEEIEGLERNSLNRVGNLTPEERRQFMDLVDELNKLVSHIIYDLEQKDKRMPYDHPLRKSKDSLMKFLSDLFNACRMAGYPESLVPQRHTDLMEKVRSSGIVNTDELAKKPRGGEHRGRRIKVRAGDIIPLGFVEDYTWFKPPERVEKYDLPRDSEADENRARLLRSVQAYLRATVRNEGSHYESLDIPDRLKEVNDNEFSREKGQYTRLVEPLLRHPIAKQAKLVGIFSHGAYDGHFSITGPRNHLPNIHDRAAIFLGDDGILYGVILQAQGSNYHNFDGSEYYDEFARSAAQSYSPLLYTENPSVQTEE